jgi:hypothetical protein
VTGTTETTAGYKLDVGTAKDKAVVEAEAGVVVEAMAEVVTST